jgi:hypothetical protein
MNQGFLHALPFRRTFDYTANGTVRSLEDSHQRMGLSRFDIVYIHDCSEDWHGPGWKDRFAEAMAGAAQVLTAMRDRGEIRAWGMGLNLVEPALACLDIRGKLLWRRAVPTPERPAGLLTSGVDVIVTGTGGAAARVRRNGRAAWRLGGAAPGAAAVPPLLERGVLLVPGEALRAVDPRSGRVLAELPGGRGIRALAVGPGLEVARLDEAGDLTLHRLAGHFAVVAARGQA